MEIKQSHPKFRPVHITIETQDELDTLKKMVNSAFVPSDDDEITDDDLVIIKEMHLKLNKIIKGELK